MACNALEGAVRFTTKHAELNLHLCPQVTTKPLKMFDLYSGASKYE